MRNLVLAEVDDLNHALAIGNVAINKSKFEQAIQASIDVNIIRRKQLHLDLLWTIQKPPLSVGKRPKSSEKQAGFERRFDKVGVFEERGLDVPGSSHLRSLPSIARNRIVQFVQERTDKFAWHDHMLALLSEHKRLFINNDFDALISVDPLRYFCHNQPAFQIEPAERLLPR
jgi:hypothetical protein